MLQFNYVRVGKMEEVLEERIETVERKSHSRSSGILDNKSC